MKKVVIAIDLHLDITGFDRARQIIEEKPDWLVIAGDLCGWDSWDKNLLSLRDALPNTQFAILPGNHEFYTRGKYDFKNGTFNKATVKQVIACQKDFCCSMGFTYLPACNQEIGDTVLVGSCLWYDYSFSEPGAYTEEQLVGGLDVARGSSWNDMRQINKGSYTDRTLTQYMVRTFRKHLKDAQKTGKKIIAITHMLPRVELNAHAPSLFNAYSGTVEAGKALDALGDQLVAAYCGHTHKAAKFGKYQNIGNDYSGPLRYEVLSL